MQPSSIQPHRTGPRRPSLFVLIVMLMLSWACSLSPTVTTESGTTPGANRTGSTFASPSGVNATGSAQPGALLIGKWQNDSTKQVIEYTGELYILYDFPAPKNQLQVKYSLPNDHTIQLDLKDSTPFEFSIKANTLTLIGRDGKVSSYTRIGPP